MKKKILSFALALTMCLGLLPRTAFADESNPPDWYFLFAIFKNVDADCLDADKVTRHAKYAMTQDEVEVARSYAKEFEMYMNQLGVMRAHVDVVEIDTPITELQESDSGSYLGSKQAASLLDSKVDLDQYDHVTCIVSLNVHTGYGGITGSEFENATGQSCINFVNRDWCLSVWAVGVYPWAPGYPVHEYLHFMERMNKRWGRDFDLHIIMENFYERVNNEYEECYTDIILNRAKGTAGTGVIPEAWQYPPRLIRTMRETVHEVTIPSDISVIGDKAFQHFANLSEVKFHSGVTAIGVAAFEWCTSLTEVNIPSSVIKIGDWAFQGCTTLTEMSIPASVTSIGEGSFEYAVVRLAAADAVVHITSDQLMSCFLAAPDDGIPFDFARYDDQLLVGRGLPDHLGALLHRVAAPFRLAPVMRDRIVEALRERAAEACQYVAREGDITMVRALADAGFLDDGDLFDRQIERLRASNRTDCVLFLMNWQHDRTEAARATTPKRARDRFAL